MEVVVLAMQGYQPLGGGCALGLFLPPSHENEPLRCSEIAMSDEPLVNMSISRKRLRPENSFDSEPVYKRSKMAFL